MSTLLNPYFGEFGGMYVPQILMPALRQLEEAFVSAQKDPAFQAEFTDLLKNYAGRPTALTKCRNLTEGTRTTLYLKREDLLHGGAHKTNQVLGQALLAKRMGKTEIIAETGAGQHGVASALASALLGLKCRIYMGAKDVERQKPNVFRMELMGAKVVPVTAGSGTLKEACNAALRNWAESFEDTHYMLGTAAGPHPFPTIVREFQKVIGEEARAQFAEAENGLLPDAVIACVGGGSNAIGQDLWARIWAGARTSLIIAFFVALIEAVVGITVGVLWGYVRQLDFFFTELYNICDNVPSTIILILISYVASPSVQTLILGMSITGWIAMARFIRNQILIIRDRDYNVASRCIGTPTARIVLRNLLPYLVSVIMLRMALTIPAAIGSEVFITYIGLGLSVETPSLGNLVNDGRKVMMQAGLRYQLLYPTIILSFVTIAFYLIGNAFSDAADPKNHLQ